MTKHVRRWVRPALYAFGVVLLVGTLVAARFLSPGAGGADPSPKPVDPVAAKGTGPIVLGFVDSDPPVVTYGLPPNMQTGLVARVFVREGDEVAADAPLFAFDTTIQEATYQQALAAVEVAKQGAAVAKATAADHASKIALAKEAVAAAKLRENGTSETYRVTEVGLRQAFVAQFRPEEVEKRLADDPKLLELRIAKQTAEQERKLREAELASVEKTGVPAASAAQAEAVVGSAEKAAATAKAAIDLGTVKARVPGRVERLNVSAGDVMGIGSNNKAVWFVPTGPRIVRAEVEAEFAHRVMPEVQAPGAAKRELTVYDNADSKLTYKGFLKRVGTSYLPKRSGGDGLVPNDTKVLECVVEVPDFAPAGQPPLRVGQKVRVNFGQ